jgi:hypothetical protein
MACAIFAVPTRCTTCNPGTGRRQYDPAGGTNANRALRSSTLASAQSVRERAARSRAQGKTAVAASRDGVRPPYFGSEQSHPPARLQLQLQMLPQLQSSPQLQRSTFASAHAHDASSHWQDF